jgi:hypothetical protein
VCATCTTWNFHAAASIDCCADEPVSLNGDVFVASTPANELAL